MNCRTEVKKHLKGGELPFDREEKKLVIVFDMNKKGYRSIPVEGIQRIEINGEWFVVIHPTITLDIK